MFSGKKKKVNQLFSVWLSFPSESVRPLDHCRLQPSVACSGPREGGVRSSRSCTGCSLLLGWAALGQIICLCQDTGIRSSSWGSRDRSWILTLKSYEAASQADHSRTVSVLQNVWWHFTGHPDFWVCPVIGISALLCSAWPRPLHSSPSQFLVYTLSAKASVTLPRSGG